MLLAISDSAVVGYTPGIAAWKTQIQLYMNDTLGVPQVVYQKSNEHYSDPTRTIKTYGITTYSMLSTAATPSDFLYSGIYCPWCTKLYNTNSVFPGYPYPAVREYRPYDTSNYTPLFYASPHVVLVSSNAKDPPTSVQFEIPVSPSTKSTKSCGGVCPRKYDTRPRAGYEYQLRVCNDTSVVGSHIAVEYAFQDCKKWIQIPGATIIDASTSSPTMARGVIFAAHGHKTLDNMWVSKVGLFEVATSTLLNVPFDYERIDGGNRFLKSPAGAVLLLALNLLLILIAYFYVCTIPLSAYESIPLEYIPVFWHIGKKI